MSTQVFVGQLNCEANNGDSRFRITVGVFSDEKLAADAIENFVEGTLALEYSEVSVVSQSIERFNLDEAIDDPTQFANDQIPF